MFGSLPGPARSAKCSIVTSAAEPTAPAGIYPFTWHESDEEQNAKVNGIARPLTFTTTLLRVVGSGIEVGIVIPGTDSSEGGGKTTPFDHK